MLVNGHLAWYGREPKNPLGDIHSLTISPKTKAKVITTLTDMMGGSAPVTPSLLILEAMREREAYMYQQVCIREPEEPTAAIHHICCSHTHTHTVTHTCILLHALEHRQLLKRLPTFNPLSLFFLPLPVPSPPSFLSPPLLCISIHKLTQCLSDFNCLLEPHFAICYGVAWRYCKNEGSGIM